MSVYERNQGRTCHVCDHAAYCKGYCRKHYHQWHRTGEAVFVRPPLRLEKQCPSCQQVKSRSEFYTWVEGGQRALCKPCFLETGRWANLLKKFGLTPDAYGRLLAEQGGVCAICATGTKFDVDHDHESGAVRGLLCRRCNLLLGNVADDSALLRAAAEYLETSG